MVRWRIELKSRFLHWPGDLAHRRDDEVVEVEVGPTAISCNLMVDGIDI